jgi:hypothetical protein
MIYGDVLIGTTFCNPVNKAAGYAPTSHTQTVVTFKTKQILNHTYISYKR